MTNTLPFPAQEIEDSLRERLLLAESRIVSLQNEVERLKRPALPLSIRFRVQISAKALLLLRMNNGKCFYCAKPVEDKEVTMDHLIPRSRGGSSALRNLVPACGPCNLEKGNRMPTHHEIERATGLHSARVAEKKKQPVHSVPIGERLPSAPSSSIKTGSRSALEMCNRRPE